MWYELLASEWPFKNQPPEAIIWPWDGIFLCSKPEILFCFPVLFGMSYWPVNGPLRTSLWRRSSGPGVGYCCVLNQRFCSVFQNCVVWITGQWRIYLCSKPEILFCFPVLCGMSYWPVNGPSRTSLPRRSSGPGVGYCCVLNQRFCSVFQYCVVWVTGQWMALQEPASGGDHLALGWDIVVF